VGVRRRPIPNVDATPTPIRRREPRAGAAAMASEQPLTPAEINTLVTRAVEAKANAYAPYSKFRVGAAVLLDDGTIVQGAPRRGQP